MGLTGVSLVLRFDFEDRADIWNALGVDEFLDFNETSLLLVQVHANLAEDTYLFVFGSTHSFGSWVQIRSWTGMTLSEKPEAALPWCTRSATFQLLLVRASYVMCPRENKSRPVSFLNILQAENFDAT